MLIFAGMVVQYLPGGAAEKNIENSCKTFNIEYIYPSFNGRAADGYTDIVMFLVSSSKPDEASWKRFFTSPIYTYLDDEYISTGYKIMPIQALCSPSKYYRASYFRYWHGYQIILRPLLSFTDYEGMRKLNIYLQPFLFVVLIYLFCRRKAYGLILGWILSYLIFSPDAMPYNITYSVIYYISVISAILLMIYKEKIEQYIGWPIFFMMVGIVTNYFDFLTYPIVSLAVPLTILFYLEPSENFKDMLKTLIIIGGCWLFGYAGMWLLRGILCYFILGDYVIENIITAVLDRSNSHLFGQPYPFWMGLEETYKQLTIQPDTVISIISLCLLSVLAVLYKIKPCIKFAEKKYYQLLPFVLISMGVFVYCMIVKGHTLQHGIYVYRIWVAFFFPIISMLNFWVLQAGKKKKSGKRKVIK